MSSLISSLAHVAVGLGLAIAMILFSCAGETPQASTLSSSHQATDTTLVVHGMVCEGCAQRIEGTLKETKGIVSAKVSYPDQRAYIRYVPESISVSQIIEKVKHLGYGAEVAGGS